jgi:hypothetical protein
MLKEYLLSYRKTIISHSIAFAFGFAIATLIIINIGSDEKYTETDLKRAELIGRDKMDIKLSEEHKIELEALNAKLSDANKEIQRLKSIPVKVYKPTFKTDAENQKWFDEESGKYTNLRR